MSALGAAATCTLTSRDTVYCCLPLHHATGLLVACAGELRRSELAAVVASLFSDIAARAAADLELPHIDELTLSDPARGRLVVRPLDLRGRPRLFLVAQVPRGRSWRRSTTLTARRLDAVLRPLLAPEEPAP